MEIAIVDDQERAREELASLVQQSLHARSIPSCPLHFFATGSELLLSQIPFDVVFLDIQMPGPDGMDTARELRAHGFRGELVFTTVLSEYVFDAFSVSAADFLVKPVTAEKVAAVLGRIFAGSGRESRFVIGQRTGTAVVHADDLQYCEVRGRRLFLNMRDGRTLTFNGKMEVFAAQADRRFFRCHRSYLVNMDHVAGFGDGQILLCSGERIPLSRLREMDFRQALLTHLRKRPH